MEWNILASGTSSIAWSYGPCSGRRSDASFENTRRYSWYWLGTISLMGRISFFWYSFSASCCEYVYVAETKSFGVLRRVHPVANASRKDSSVPSHSGRKPGGGGLCHEQALGATYIVPARCQAKLDIASFWRSWFSGWSVPNIELALLWLAKQVMFCQTLQDLSHHV